MLSVQTWRYLFISIQRCFSAGCSTLGRYLDSSLQAQTASPYIGWFRWVNDLALGWCHQTWESMRLGRDFLIEGSLEVKLPTIWTGEKQRWEESKRKVEERRAEERRSEKRKSQKKEDAGARKGRRVAKHFVFPMICGSGGSKSTLAKAAGAEPSGQMRDEKLHAVVARSTFPSQNIQTTTCSDHFRKLGCRKSARRCGAKHISKSKCTKHQVWTTFGSWHVEKVHAVVARSTSASEKTKSISHSDHFWKLRCLKSARCCGAKHISKSKC